MFMVLKFTARETPKILGPVALALAMLRNCFHKKAETSSALVAAFTCRPSTHCSLSLSIYRVLIKYQPPRHNPFFTNHQFRVIHPIHIHLRKQISAVTHYRFWNHCQCWFPKC
ncbi:hypothetical protein RND81_01G138900 [Saponaria officinalis]|uniref:Secreted protein n=1 Tax=Saponaria officinalis TaxID=3572 RepID=A0AAW1N9X4_SAPOF